MMDIRIGFGYDVHRFVSNRKLVLGGIEIPHNKGLLGHSDADALLHAIIDALLGALALGDIGSHFPDTDAKWQGADSAELLKAAYAMVRECGYQLNNLDSTVIAERPKLKPHIPAMRERIANLLNCQVGQISIKATTNEKMDSFGREEGLAAMATALLSKVNNG
jgi:2-C-methyl-D-erythritol 2,4-cyclodiphosphate synthase